MDKDTTKSVLTEYLAPLNTESILQELNRLQLDRCVKKLGTTQFLGLFVFAQVKQIGALIDISLELEANEQLQKEIDLESISTSQLSRKLRDVPPAFTDFVFRQCVERIGRQVGMKRTNERLGRIHVVDSSTISMCLSQYRWAEFRKTKAGVKLHLRLVFIGHQVVPDKAVLTHPDLQIRRRWISWWLSIPTLSMYLIEGTWAIGNLMSTAIAPLVL